MPSWGNLQADYQRRADLIPNLVATVKGYAQQEKTVLTQVDRGARQSRPASSSMPATSAIPAKVQAFANAQSSSWVVRSGACWRASRLIPTSSRITTSWHFRTSSKGPENRIEVARRDYNEDVRKYNTLIRTFPTAIGAKVFYGAKPKVPFEASAAAQQAPSVNFNAS